MDETVVAHKVETADAVRQEHQGPDSVVAMMLMAVAGAMNHENGGVASLQVVVGLDHVHELDVRTHSRLVVERDVAVMLLNAFSGVVEVVDRSDAH